MEHVISGEIIVEYDSHVADDGQFLDEFLEEGGVEVEAVTHADDYDGRIELFEVDVDQFLHDELDELGLIELHRPHVILLRKVPRINWKHQ